MIGSLDILTFRLSISKVLSFPVQLITLRCLFLVGRGGVVLHKTLMLVITKKVFKISRHNLRQGALFCMELCPFFIRTSSEFIVLDRPLLPYICPLVYTLLLSFTAILYFMRFSIVGLVMAPPKILLF